MNAAWVAGMIWVRVLCFGEGVVDLGTEDAEKFFSRGSVLLEALLEALPLNPVTRARK